MIKPGKYRHFKGKYDQVIGTAIHSETLEEMAVYKPLYKNRKYPQNTIWVRPISMFCEKITVNGKIIDRFKFISNIK